MQRTHKGLSKHHVLDLFVQLVGYTVEHFQLSMPFHLWMMRPLDSLCIGESKLQVNLQTLF